MYSICWRRIFWLCLLQIWSESTFACVTALSPSVLPVCAVSRHVKWFCATFFALLSMLTFNRWVVCQYWFDGVDMLKFGFEWQLFPNLKEWWEYIEKFPCSFHCLFSSVNFLQRAEAARPSHAVNRECDSCPIRCDMHEIHTVIPSRAPSSLRYRSWEYLGRVKLLLLQLIQFGAVWLLWPPLKIALSLTG